MELVLNFLASPFFYAYLWLGIIAGGDVVLLPALYIAADGIISLSAVIAIALAAAFVADTLWYAAGRFLKKDTLSRLPFIKLRASRARRFARFIEKHGVHLAFAAKFVFGTRAAVQLLCGIRRVRYVPFIVASTSGSALWIGILTLLLFFVDVGVAALQITAYRVQIALLAFIGLAFAARITAAHIASRYFRNGRIKR